MPCHNGSTDLPRQRCAWTSEEDRTVIDGKLRGLSVQEINDLLPRRSSKAIEQRWYSIRPRDTEEAAKPAPSLAQRPPSHLLSPEALEAVRAYRELAYVVEDYDLVSGAVLETLKGHEMEQRVAGWLDSLRKAFGWMDQLEVETVEVPLGEYERLSSAAG